MGYTEISYGGFCTHTQKREKSIDKIRQHSRAHSWTNDLTKQAENQSIQFECVKYTFLYISFFLPLNCNTRSKWFSLSKRTTMVRAACVLKDACRALVSSYEKKHVEKKVDWYDYNSSPTQFKKFRFRVLPWIANEPACFGWLNNIMNWKWIKGTKRILFLPNKWPNYVAANFEWFLLILNAIYQILWIVNQHWGWQWMRSRLFVKCTIEQFVLRLMMPMLSRFATPR